MKSKGKGGKNKGFVCKVTRVMVEWYFPHLLFSLPNYFSPTTPNILSRLAIHAFRDVLQKRQSSYRKIIEWLEGRIEVLRVKERESCARMRGVVGRVAEG
jgi:hypothetical protein